MLTSRGWLRVRTSSFACILGLGTLASPSGGAIISCEGARERWVHAEPTNHLDLEACVWLEETLKQFKRILLLISHSQVLQPLTSACTHLPCTSHCTQVRTTSTILCLVHECRSASDAALHAQDFMNNVCTNIMRLHQKKLIPYGGASEP